MSRCDRVVPWVPIGLRDEGTRGTLGLRVEGLGLIPSNQWVLGFRAHLLKYGLVEQSTSDPMMGKVRAAEPR